MTASRKKPANGLQLDEIFLENAQEQAGFWSDDAPAMRPLSSRKDPAEAPPVHARPANDDRRRARTMPAAAPEFAGSRHFWTAAAASLLFGLLFAALMGFANGPQLAALIRTPGQFSGFWAALAVIAALPWVFALSAHRQAVNTEMMRRIVLATQRMFEPSAVAENAGRRISASFDQMFAEIDSRMALLDAKSTQMAKQIAAATHHSTEAADASITTLRSIVEANETQREALQRTGLMISTEILPVIARLETSVLSLEAVSQNAGAILDTVGGRLQQNTQDLKTCLEVFNNANHTVAPEIEKRMLKFEASLGRLPEQLEATIGRLSPLSETIADAAMLSTANIEVIDQLAKDITVALDQSRGLFNSVASTTTEIFREAVEAHAGQFRDMIGMVVADETARVSSLSHELNQLAGTAAAAVDSLQQPVALVSAAAEQALAGVSGSMAALDQRIEANLRSCVAELHEAAARVVSTVSRDVETSTMSLQTRLAAGSTELMQRVSSDTARFEALINETAERISGRISTALHDMPIVLAQHVEAEIARADGSLKGSLNALSEQMRGIVEAVPVRLASMNQDMLHSLQTSMEQSFADIAERSEGLDEQFRKTAMETTDAVLESYVDFIYLAVERFRKELEEVNGSFSRELAATLAQVPSERQAMQGPADGNGPPEA
ncbi:hypothetical protein DK847_17650 [Aestuariivirga litoralis]|uniref:Uncharacterized protein n=1 Tax=Aestuariivirga litoralis TaxID=2650924 RepID=A0A2W2AJM2_9HYPH|nr:hypothetical protein [Aestuariivirga litoralis]PZF75665.1 hypothetical protein DK847_17650 [Aestuariivirga litoralis]